MFKPKVMFRKIKLLLLENNFIKKSMKFQISFPRANLWRFVGLDWVGWALDMDHMEFALKHLSLMDSGNLKFQQKISQQ